MINEIKSVSDIQVIGSKLDEHVKIPTYMKKGEQYVEVPKHKFVWNMSKETVSNAVNKNFQVIQHRDIYNAVYSALSNLNLDVYGRLDDMGDYVRMDVIFKGQKKIDDKEKGIEFGIRVSNSNNKKCSFKLEMYAMRLVCMNGMTIAEVIPAVKDYQIHFGIDKIELTVVQEMTEKFVKKVINHSQDLQVLVNLAMKDSIEWEICEKILSKAVKQKKFLREIVKAIGIDVIEIVDKNTGRTKYEFVCDGKRLIKRWEIYNCITSIISHDTQLKPTAMNSLESNSREFLQHDFAKLNQIYNA